MADLLRSLTLPNSQTLHRGSSEESFHSLDDAASPNAPRRLAPEAHPSVVQPTGLQLHDIDSYLANHATLLSDPVANSKNTMSRSQKKKENQKPTAVGPTQLGSKTSHHVSALYMLCQAKGLTPVFEIEGEADAANFRGALQIGEATVALEKTWRSKKEAREALAEKGVEIVKNMDGKKKSSQAGLPEVKQNWIGTLQEYHNQTFSGTQSPLYTEYALGSAFTATCTLPSLPHHPFGSPTTPFPSKKAARSAAAKEAVSHLISEGSLSPNGSAPAARKKSKLSTASTSTVTFRENGKGLDVDSGGSFVQRVQDLAPLLGLPSPVYHLQPVDAVNAPNMLSGYATFPNAPGLPRMMGEVRNVYGKKNAREGIAEGVWGVLVELAAKRGVGVGEGEGEGPGGHLGDGLVDLMA